MKKTLVFSATYNEKNNVLKFINTFQSKYNNFDLLIVEDNSPDNTYLAIKLNIYNKKNIKIIRRKKKLGLHSAYILAFEYARKKNYDFLISIDFDLQHNLNDIARIHKSLKFSNFVIGSRYMLGGKCNLRGYRLFLSFFGNILIKYILNIPLTEFTTALRGYDKKTISLLTKSKLRNTGYSFQLEVVYKIFLAHLKIKEIPITFENRLSGKSKIPLQEPLRYARYLAVCFFKRIFAIASKF